MKIAGRYEITAKVGQGGMGVVYRAYDPAPMDREVAVKTLHEFADPLALDLFYRECRALKSISHPNIVEIFDMGEFEEGGHKRPYFVMPLLPGQTLDQLIRTASHRLTVDRVVEIMSQTCRGLQAAHDRGLIHRDLKPSNIFVMSDDSVKLIDFGVAHAVTARSRTTGFDKGTLLYMAPEQIQHKPVSAQSDIYALGLTMYEALTRRQPFRLGSEAEVIEAILNHVPVPASGVNPAVSPLMSRAVQKAIAKQPWNRYETAREFAETLQKALRNEPIPMFDPARVQPRIQTALKALEDGDEQFAGEIVGELEAEGGADSQISILRAQIDQTVRRKTRAKLLESARLRYEQGEEPLALQKIHELLHLDPDDAAALELKARIEEGRSDREFERWITLARQHADNHAYANAHDALQKAIALRPDDSRVSRAAKDIEHGQTVVRLPSETMVRPPAIPAASAPIPMEKRREPSSPLRLVGIVGAIAAVATIAVITFVWRSPEPAKPTPAQAAAPAPAPAPASAIPAPVAAAPSTSTPAIESQPAPTTPPVTAAPTPVPARNPSVTSPPRRTDTAAPAPPAAAPPPVASTPPPQPVQPTTPAPLPSSPQLSPSAVDAATPPMLRAARAAELMDLAAKSENAEDWPAALSYYQRARALDPSWTALASTGVTRVQENMLADGAAAFKRAQGFDASNRVNDAITWYERAVRNLPESSPEKRIATDRLRALKPDR